LFDTFLNAWWIAVKAQHNSEMEYLNNPTPEVIYKMTRWNEKVRKLQRWSAVRWGTAIVAKAIYEKENRT